MVQTTEKTVVMNNYQSEQQKSFEFIGTQPSMWNMTKIKKSEKACGFGFKIPFEVTEILGLDQ